MIEFCRGLSGFSRCMKPFTYKDIAMCGRDGLPWFCCRGWARTSLSIATRELFEMLTSRSVVESAPY